MDYKLIPLTGKYGEGKSAKVSPEDYDDLRRFKWHVNYSESRQAPTSVRRAMTVAEGGLTPSGRHRLIAMHNYLMRPPEGMEVDHINHDPLDNRRENLRICRRKNNLQNRRPWGRSKYKGVIRDGDRWQLNFKLRFDTEEEAAAAYNKAIVAVQGEYAVLNDIPSSAD